MLVFPRQRAAVGQWNLVLDGGVPGCYPDVVDECPEQFPERLGASCRLDQKVVAGGSSPEGRFLLYSWASWAIGQSWRLFQFHCQQLVRLGEKHVQVLLCHDRFHDFLDHQFVELVSVEIWDQASWGSFWLAW